MKKKSVFKDDKMLLQPIEIERYELANLYDAIARKIDRRQFLKLLNGGVLVLLAGGGLLAQQGCDPGPQGRGGFDASMPKNIDAWLHIGANGKVTVFTGKVEVGQGVRTSLAQIVAEELDTPLASIEMIMGDTDLTPFDRGTFASMTTRVMGAQLRQVAAATRQALIELAAQKWNLPVAQLITHNGKVVHDNPVHKATYGELTRGEKIVHQLRDDMTTKPTVRWTIAGHSVPRVEAVAKVTGAARYTADLRPPGLLFGRVVRPASFGAILKSVDFSAAENMLGVVKVMRDGDFVGVVAEHPSIAAQAVRVIKTEWDEREQPSHYELFAVLKSTAEKQPTQAESGGLDAGEVLAENGSLEDGFSLAAKTFSQSYRTAYIAHAPLEPRAAVAEWKGTTLTVWTCTQIPFGVRRQLVRRFNLPEESVRVIVLETGSAYGGKHPGDAAVEAATLARSVGRPVQVRWTREEEFTWAYFRPAALIEIKSGVSANGALVAWEYHNYNSGQRGAVPPYDIPHAKIMFHKSQSPLRQGSYRALANGANSFARESHIDEIAASLGEDPLEFRLKHISDNRLRAVAEAAAKRFGWQAQRGTSAEKTSQFGASTENVARGVGFACGIDVGSYVAEIAEVEVDKESGELKILRVVVALDCGCVINPDGLHSQIEGCIIQAIGGALQEQILFERGKILNATFSSYPVPRFSDTPPIEIVVLDRKEVPSTGAGEPPLIGVAPALGNALFNATGVRLRELPMTAEKIGAALATA